MTLPIAGRVNRGEFSITVDTIIGVVETRDCSNRRGLSTPMPGVHSLGAPYATIQTEQSVAHGAAGRAVSEINVFRRGPVNGVVTRLKPMLLADFAKLLDTSTADAIAFARSMVLDELPDRFTYRVFPNQSCDEHLEPDEVVHPDDALGDLHDYIEMGRDDCIRYLYRDGRVPEWIDISVGAVDYDFTYIYLRCCGRFTANDERLYYKRCDRGPFGIKSPAIPPHIELGDRETKFWIGDAVPPPRSG